MNFRRIPKPPPNRVPRVRGPFREPFITRHSRPVLADGLFLHVAPFDKDQEADVEMPNINCAKCTLQVIEFMAAHNRNRSPAVRQCPFSSVGTSLLVAAP